MSNIYKIGTRGITPSDNNHLVYDADVGRLYIDKDTPVDVISADTIKESLGISSDGSTTKYLNEQGNFVEVDVGSDTSFDSDFFIIGDDGTVTLKLAGTGTKGIAGFNIPEFNVDEIGFVSLRTRKVTGTNSLFAVDYVKEWETYSDGSWYRLWASGWLEQGYGGASFTTKDKTITLLREYKDTNYSIHGVGVTISGIGGQGIKNVTTTSFTTYSEVRTTLGRSWMTCGWAAE